MSRVFVATDTALGRRIVVKVMRPDAIAQVSIDRFKREIRLAARLQHPHIVPLLSAGDMDALPYFTMPFVQGESLRERLATKGELPINTTVHILRDVASALAYAHGAGVVHRDIKPDNIILSGGVAVVADFGVAKALDLAATHGDGERGALTSMGIALGTPAYMAPEQAAGDPNVDHRADIYSFGCVAYEMLTGASPFANRPFAQILAAHVQEQPEPVAKRRAGLPPALAALVTSCLEKRPEDRPQSASALLATLDTIATPSGEAVSSVARTFGPRASPGRIALVVGAVIVVAGAAIAAWFARASGTHLLHAGRVTSIATTSALEMNPAISPDGKFVAYMLGAPGSYHIRVRQIAGERSVDVSAELPGEHSMPHWSPDGSQIAFVANKSAYAVSSTGGSTKLLAESPGAEIGDVAWSPDGKSIAYTTAFAGLWIKPDAGGDARSVIRGQSLHSIAWSPNGTKIAYVEGIPPGLNNLSAGSIKVVDVATAAVVVVAPGDVVNLSPVWTPDGRSLLFTSNREGTLDVYQQFLTVDGRPSGPAQRISTGLSARRISLSADGTRVAYDVVRNRSNIWSVDVPSAGGPAASMASAHQITSDNQRIEALSLSHDEQWLAYDSDRAGNADIYKVKIDGGDPVQLTTNPGGDFMPSWSSDDRRILFHSSRTGSREVFSIAADGSAEQQLTNVRNDLYSPEESLDGRHLFAYAGIGAARKGSDRFDVVFDRDASGGWSNMRRWTPKTVSSRWFHLSHDGEWLGYVTSSPEDVLGGTVRVARIDGSDDHQVLDLRPNEAGSYLAFGRNPSTMFIMTQRIDRRYSVYAVPVAGGAARLLLRDDAAHRISRWDFATDGRRLFFTLAADESDVFMMELSRCRLFHLVRYERTLRGRSVSARPGNTADTAWQYCHRLALRHHAPAASAILGARQGHASYAFTLFARTDSARRLNARAIGRTACGSRGRGRR